MNIFMFHVLNVAVALSLSLHLLLCVQDQAVEREHERDEFQQEIGRLEAQLRQTASAETKGHRVRVHGVCSTERVITRILTTDEKVECIIVFF